MKKLTRSLIGLGAGLLAAVSLHAQSISITNSSFESGSGYNGGSPPSPTVLPGWTTASSGGGTYGNTVNCTAVFTAGLSGTNAIEVGGEIDQLTAATFTTGVTYTMTVDIGNPNNIGATSATVTFGFRNTTNNGFLGSGGNLAVSAATINAIPDGTFQTFSFTYTALAGDNGNGIRIGISDGYNGPYDYRLDNVTLTAAAVPEPSTYAALAGVCALGFVLVSRRRAGVVRA